MFIDYFPVVKLLYLIIFISYFNKAYLKSLSYEAGVIDVFNL